MVSKGQLHECVEAQAGSHGVARCLVERRRIQVSSNTFFAMSQSEAKRARAKWEGDRKRATSCAK